MKKKILVIDACVRQEASRTKKLMEEAVRTLAGQHPDWSFDTIELTKPGLSYMDRDSLEERDRLLAAKEFGHPRFALARQFSEAEGVILAAPFWDLSTPAVFKVYVENVSVDGITFCCDEEGLHGLCRAEWMLHVVTRGGVWEEDMQQDRAYAAALCRFFGIGAYHIAAAQGIDIAGLDHEKIMEDALREVRSICRTLS